MSQSNSISRLCLFAHFDKDNIIDEYVIFYLRDIRKVASKIIFISTSSLSPEMTATLGNICDSIIIKKNEGYDFASWHAALKLEKLENYDELILCNDSVYGPFFPLKQIFSEMTGVECDFWGMTSNYDIAYHVQSYFLVFRKSVLASRVFQEFWENMEISQSKANVVRSCEVGLSQILLNAGFKNSTYVQYRFLFRHAIFYRIRFHLVRTGRNIIGDLRASLFSINQRQKGYSDRRIAVRMITYMIGFILQSRNIIRNGYSIIIDFICYPGKKINHLFSYFKNILRSMNVTHFLWKPLILYYKMPFIKVDLLRDNRMAMDVDDYAEVISMVSDYNIEMIESHLKRVKISSDT
ncbi:MAG: rhamnan synthesis F family protein [Smithella sp.]